MVAVPELKARMDFAPTEKAERLIALLAEVRQLLSEINIKVTVETRGAEPPREQIAELR